MVQSDLSFVLLGLWLLSLSNESGFNLPFGLCVGTLLHCVEGRVEFDVELGAYEASFQVEYQGDVACVLGRSANVDADPRTLFPFMVDPACLEAGVEYVYWTTEGFPVLDVRIDICVGEHLKWRFSAFVLEARSLV